MNDNLLNHIMYPRSDSPAFSLNTIDWMKGIRFLGMQFAGWALTFLIPALTRFSYVYHGYDFTFAVGIALSFVAEMLRRYISNHN